MYQQADGFVNRQEPPVPVNLDERDFLGQWLGYGLNSTASAWLATFRADRLRLRAVGHFVQLDVDQFDSRQNPGKHLVDMHATGFA